MPAAALWTIGGFAAVTGLFGVRQNRGEIVGGRISLPKVLWLNLTLTVFFGLPCVLWLHGDPLYGWLFLSFVLRGAVELYLIYATRGWKCVYGIGHDLFTLGLAYCLKTETVGGFFWVYCAVLAVEAGMAWAFSRLADPSQGIYFASDDERFRTVNIASWAASLAGYAALAGLLLP